MQKFVSQRDSRPCACGGKVQGIPDVVRRHGETQKHSKWRFQILCNEFLDLSLPLRRKIELLKEMKQIVPFLP